MTFQPVRAMVMAAGAGTRLRPLTHTVPKPMVPIANRPVLEYTIENLARHGITEMIFNLHNYPEQIRHYFGNGARWGVRIHYSYEPQLLGTAGGVKKVEAFLKPGTFLVLSGDGLTTVDLDHLLSFHRRKKSFGTIGLKPVDLRFEYGVTLTNGQDRVTQFVEKPSWSDVYSNQVNTGIYVLEPKALRYIPTGKPYDFGHQFWPLLLKKKMPIFGYPVKQYWCDVGNLAEYRRAQRDALDGAVGIKMPGRQIRKGVWVDEGTRIGPRVRLEPPCLIGKDCRVERGAVIGAYTVIGHRARIGDRSVLKNCILWNDVRVGNRVNLENCILGHGAHATESITVYEAAVINISR